MIKLGDIAKTMVKEGGKLFGPRADRVSSSELRYAFDFIKELMHNDFGKMELAKFLPSKQDHGDIDIVVLNDKKLDLKSLLRKYFEEDLIDYSKNGEICSALLKFGPFLSSERQYFTAHVDFITVEKEEDFDAQFEYLSWNDFSGILGVMSRKCRFNYGTHGFFKIYEDKKKQFHYILLTKNLKEGLNILGYRDVISDYDNIKTADDIIKFIGSSPMFDSSYYVGNFMNHSDRKRVRTGRPTADYIRKGLIGLHKTRKTEDDDFFLKTLYPTYYEHLKKKVEDINEYVLPTAKWGGEWIMKTFPQIKPGPIISKIKQDWKEKFGDNIDDVPEEELKQVTSDFIKNHL